MKGVPSTRLTCAFIFLVVFAVFSGALDNKFVMWDDSAFVYKNPFITSLSLENLWIMATTFHYSNWQPLTWLSHAIDYRLYGLHPSGHHLTSVLFHCWNTFWVFLIVREYIAFTCKQNIDSKPLWRSALIAALFFGLHPLRVESVAWVSERKDVLSTFLAFPVYLTYLRYVTAREAKDKSYWMRISLLLFFLSLTAKPMPLTLPVILLLLDYFPLGRWKNISGLIPLIREKIPFFILSLASAAVTLIAQKQIGAIATLEDFDLSIRISNAFRSICFIYLEKSFWPINLSPFYYYPKEIEGSWIYASIFLFITWLCYKTWQIGRPIFAIAWLYFLITLFPVIGIVQVGEQAAADRYTYLPSLSMSVLIGAGLYSARYFTVTKRKISLNPIAAILMSAGLIFFSVLTFKQVKVWEESLNFWTSIGEKNPERGKWTLLKRGNALLMRGKIDEAEEKFNEGLKYRPNDLFLHFSLGTVYTLQEKYIEAEAEYNKTLEISNNFSPVYNALGKLYSLTGKTDLAEKNLKKCIELTPKFGLAYINLGELYLKQNKLKLAEKSLLTALKYRPTSPNAYDNLGLIYFKRKNYPKAEMYFRKSIENEADYFPAFKHLGELYEKTDSLAKAIAAYQKILDILPNDLQSKMKLDELKKNK